MEKLDMKSKDFVSENVDYISVKFPNCVTEGTDGKVIDFDLLKQELSNDITSGNKERYRLEWPGKKEAIVTANIPTTKTLRPIREDSVYFDTTENIYIEGDNLEVLKILQESYLGKIKMIYIDPPYNTGNDFVYMDNFKQSTEDYKDQSGQVDEYNQHLYQNPETSGRYHSNWLSMMYPRLKLARNLLQIDGVIFISIDENEVENLKKLCNEIFGEHNFLTICTWQKKYSVSNNIQGIASITEYILCYSKSNQFKNGLLPRTAESTKRYKNFDNDQRGPWKAVDYWNQASPDKRPNLVYDIINPNTNKIIKPSKKAWKFSKEVHLKHVEENRIWWGKKGDNSVPALKLFLSEVKDGLIPHNWWSHDEVGHTDNAKKELLGLFQGIETFDTPKPTSLINRMIQIANFNKNETFLDFFSGSASSAHAIIKANSIDELNIKHISVQLQEKISEESKAYQAGYKSICDIGKERIRRAAKKIKEETGADIDYGFRVYRLDDSNMQDVYYTPQEYKQKDLELFKDNVKPDRTAEDLLTQVILDWGLPLSLKIDKAKVEGKEVFKVAGNSLYACFDLGIDEAFAKAIAVEQPLRIVFKDASFKDDTAKENVKQLLKQLSPETEMRVI